MCISNLQNSVMKWYVHQQSTPIAPHNIPPTTCKSPLPLITYPPPMHLIASRSHPPQPYPNCVSHARCLGLKPAFVEPICSSQYNMCEIRFLI